MAEAERVRGNLLAALRAGIIIASTRAELITAGSDLEAARAEYQLARSYAPTQIPAAPGKRGGES
jgi:hypothetical protein